MRYHSGFMEAKTDEGKDAKETCQKYVWGKTEATGKSYQ
ncbi:hypothetical protein GXM_07999 [Nostoc sphaeroides CCNUC1]|uniref:Uncharacterized protein n=1 Tax=Nostoc sphaeroides CCNUC1 TaxID=2653204 RepID=A0A5P8WCG8_9NOSO|nr:hypothetical protein GXM_07999 [Nostoc sphaeroides CCNUC1]